MLLAPPVFVVGCPRSGTTLLYHQLLSAGGFAIYRTEVKAFTYLAPLSDGFKDRKKNERFLQTWLESEDFLRSGLGPVRFRDRVRNECRSTGDFQRILMESMCEEQGAIRWADCTPDNSLHMKEIKDRFPDALFIHIIRDGRDVAMSLAAQGWVSVFPWNSRESYVPAALYWDWIVERGRTLGRLIGDDYLELHFRDLVLEPEETLREISKFIDLDLDYNRILEAGIGSVRRPNTSFTGTVEGDFNPIGRWKAAPEQDELRTVELAIGKQLKELGYEVTSPRGGLRARLATSFDRCLYRGSFSARTWLKHRTRLGGWLGDDSLLRKASNDCEDDRTLRPGANAEFIRGLVCRGP